MKSVPAVLLVLSTALVAGCPQHRGIDPPAAPAAPAARIRGTAVYLERVKMPPGAWLRVELLDAASGRTLATTEVRNVGGPPIPFVIDAPPAARDATRALRATLTGPDGERWFETPAPVALMPGGNVELLMRRAARAASAPAPAPAAPGPLAHWECGELAVMSRFDRAAGPARLDHDGHRLDLPLARSASGARYADAAGNEFWTKGATGTLALAGQPRRDCVQAAQASPWNQAVLRGATFRAVGSEPGWSVEIAGTPPRLSGAVDYGERRLDAAVRADADGWTGTDSHAPLRLRARRAECRDGMSGFAFEATVTLDVAGRTYAGCGAWLQD